MTRSTLSQVLNCSVQCFYLSLIYCWGGYVETQYKKLPFFMRTTLMFAERKQLSPPSASDWTCLKCPNRFSLRTVVVFHTDSSGKAETKLLLRRSYFQFFHTVVCAVRAGSSFELYGTIYRFIPYSTQMFDVHFDTLFNAFTVFLPLLYFSLFIRPVCSSIVFTLLI